MKMPFGKHKGIDTEDLPLDYLIWMRENLTLNRALSLAIETAINLQVCPPNGIPARFIQQIYRTLVFKWHPDQGGSESGMKALNDFYSELKNFKE